MRISYSRIIKACKNKHYCIGAVSEAGFIVAAVNQGIDGHLEACFVPDRGDSYVETRRPGPRGVRELTCKVSPESLPVLLRRLYEAAEKLDPEQEDEHEQDRPDLLANDILYTLGITNV